MTHTPGPWAVTPTSNPDNGSSWRNIVSLGCEFSPSYVGEALEQDAGLIAAAPELLAHLKFAVKLLKPLFGHTFQIEQMEAAIAKAEGTE